jgi:hypothetical protein
MNAVLAFPFQLTVRAAAVAAFRLPTPTLPSRTTSGHQTQVMKTILLCFAVLGAPGLTADSLNRIGGFAGGGGFRVAPKHAPKPQPVKELDPASVSIKDGNIVFHSGIQQGKEFANGIRIVGGKRVDLWRRWLWEENAQLHPGIAPNPLPNWFRLSGKVTQADAGGGSLVRLDNSDETVWIKNGPTDLDDKAVTLWVTLVGKNNYASVSGARRVVRAFDYGTDPTPEQRAEAVAELTTELARINETQKAEAEAVAKAKAERKAKLDEAVRKFRAEQAAKGEATNP